MSTSINEGPYQARERGIGWFLFVNLVALTVAPPALPTWFKLTMMIFIKVITIAMIIQSFSPNRVEQAHTYERKTIITVIITIITITTIIIIILVPTWSSPCNFTLSNHRIKCSLPRTLKYYL